MSTSVAAPTVERAAERAPAPTILGVPKSRLRTGLMVVAVLAVIYVFYHVSSFMNSPFGNAVKKALGAGAAILSALAGLPTWLLIGLGMAYLFGPMVAGIGGKALRKIGELYRKVRGGKEGQSPEEAKAYEEGAGSEAAKRVAQEEAKKAGAGDEAAQEKAAQAESVQAAAQADAEAKGVGEEFNEGADEAAEEFPEVEGFRPCAC